MTSKNLFFKLIAQDFRKRIWCPLSIFIIDFLALEVYFLLGSDSVSRYQNTYKYSVSYYLSDIFFAGNTISPIMILTILSAIICAISGYTYLHSRMQLDMYHSLPVKRGTIYAAKYIAGIAYYLIPLVLHIGACLLIGIIQNAFSTHALMNAIGYICILLLIYLTVYSTCILAVMLTGNIIITILISAILLTYSLLLEILRNALYQNFYYSNIMGYNPEFAAFSPMHMVIRLLEHSMSAGQNEPYYYSAFVPYVFVILIAVLLITVTGYVLYRIRSTEAAGRAIAFRRTEPVIKAMIVIPLSLYSGLFFENLSPSGISFGWYLFGAVFGFLMSAFFVEIIFRFDIRCAFHHCSQLLFNGACIALIIAVFKTDALGYNTYIPSDSEISDCSVSISGLMNASTQTAQGYTDAEEYRMEHMHISDNSAVMQLARKAASQGLHFTTIDYYDGIEQTPEYQAIIEKESSYRRIAFGYHLQNGKNVYRQYYIDIKDQDSLKLLSSIYDDIDYKANSMPLFANGWNTAYTAVNCSGQYEAGSISLNDEKKAALLEAYQSEFMNLSLDEIMDSYPVATLEFVGKQVTYNQYTYYPSDEGYPVYPSFVRTIELLKEYGFDCEQKCPVDMIDAVTVTNYSSERSDGTYPYIVYTDKDKIQQILDNSLQDQLVYSVYSYLATEEKYTVYIGNENQSYDYYNELSNYVPKKDKLPEFVIQDFTKLEKE